MTAVERGREGERIAEEYLQVKGYSIRERNFRVRAGEVDIVAEKQGVIVFVEVKCRKSDAFSFPGEAVTRQKQRKLRTAASLWLVNHEGDQKPARFDVVEIIFGLSDKAPRIHHIENAF
jgi:putative endonuclease